eukprot:CAMPEP_0113729310 /NCGR_PEP_ID=MMETSP0038_2-20120614/42467_1 /TAXON_ID=2898 /ORGANISM="Cryptomonas paramecium" /LENGTH=175 /DNA_ID=CAMNT_0000661115 /DNA_START=126 /DNA_END=650 /DNA_ORIENTATION=+ /assembly_acc=CAM_ASM_000170
MPDWFGPPPCLGVRGGWLTHEPACARAHTRRALAGGCCVFGAGKVVDDTGRPPKGAACPRRHMPVKLRPRVVCGLGEGKLRVKPPALLVARRGSELAACLSPDGEVAGGLLVARRGSELAACLSPDGEVSWRLACRPTGKWAGGRAACRGICGQRVEGGRGGVMADREPAVLILT